MLKIFANLVYWLSLLFLLDKIIYKLIRLRFEYIWTTNLSILIFTS